MSKKEVRTIGVLTSGGDAPGMNAAPGIRSLSPEHKDYHGIYCGSERSEY